MPLLRAQKFRERREFTYVTRHNIEVDPFLALELVLQKGKRRALYVLHALRVYFAVLHRDGLDCLLLILRLLRLLLRLARVGAGRLGLGQLALRVGRVNVCEIGSHLNDRVQRRQVQLC